MTYTVPMPRTLEYEGRGDWLQGRGWAIIIIIRIIKGNLGGTIRKRSVPHGGDHLKEPSGQSSSRGQTRSLGEKPIKPCPTLNILELNRLELSVTLSGFRGAPFLELILDRRQNFRGRSPEDPKAHRRLLLLLLGL